MPGATAIGVPDIVGRPEAIARQMLTTTGLVAAVITREDAQVPHGTVVSASPAPGQPVAGGSTVTVYVAVALVQVPDVIGSPYAPARHALNGIGLTVAAEQTPTDDPSRIGVVAGQVPPAGTKVPAGSRVTLTYYAAARPSRLADPPVPPPSPTAPGTVQPASPGTGTPPEPSSPVTE